MPTQKERLAVVIPVYNEEEAVLPLLDKWSAMLDALDADYMLHAYNDGSSDNSLKRLQEWAKAHPGKITVFDKPNEGHGPTILAGYRRAAADGYDWIFQIDSDDEMGPEEFADLWSRRSGFDFLAGRRSGRRQSFSRKIISQVSRLVVRTFYGKSVWDVNVPYRLMRAAAFADIFEMIPPKTFAPNLILSGMAAQNGLRSFEIPVPQKDRQTGEVSIKKWKLAKAAVKSFGQTCAFSLKANGRIYSFILILLLLLGGFNSSHITQRGDFVDSAVYMTAAKAQLDGGSLYLDFFDHKGPFFHCLNYWGFRLTHNGWGMWFIETLILSFGVLFLFHAAKRFFHPAAVLLWLFCFILIKDWCNTPDLIAILLNLWCLALLLRRPGDVKHSFLIGSIGALIFFSKQTCVLFNLGVGLYLFYLALREKRGKPFFSYLAGWCACSAAIIGFLFHYQIAEAYWRDCFVFNVHYGRTHGGHGMKGLQTVLSNAPKLFFACCGFYALYRKKLFKNEIFFLSLFLWSALLVAEICFLFTYSPRQYLFLCWLPIIGILDLLTAAFVHRPRALLTPFLVLPVLLYIPFAFQNPKGPPPPASPLPLQGAEANPRSGGRQNRIPELGARLIRSHSLKYKFGYLANVQKNLPEWRRGFRANLSEKTADLIRHYPDSPLFVWRSLNFHLYLETGRNSPIPYWYAVPLLTPGFLTDQEMEDQLTQIKDAYPLIVIDAGNKNDALKITPLPTENPPRKNDVDYRFIEGLRRFVQENFFMIECEETSGDTVRVYIPNVWADRGPEP